MATTTSTTGPSVAERVRNACAHAEQAVLAISRLDPITTTVHHLRAGDAVVAVPLGSSVTELLRGGELPAVLELTDHSPLTLREPVRSLVWLRGNLHSVPGKVQRALAGEVAGEHAHPALLDVGHSTTLLRLVLESAVVADATGAQRVRVEELRHTEPDPFWELEAAWLQHLDADHPEVIESLARKLPAGLRRGRIRPLAIDRYGITLRIENSEGDRDVRLTFAEPADTVEGLSRALRILMGCPFLNGLHRRG